MKQFTKLIEFRQAVYEHGLTHARDAQFELVDAILLSPVVRSFPELSLSPCFRRQWTSAYEVIRKGEQGQDWLECYFMHLIPKQGCKVSSLDGIAWLHPQAKVMEDLQYVYSPTPAIDGGNSVIMLPIAGAIVVYLNLSIEQSVKNPMYSSLTVTNSMYGLLTKGDARAHITSLTEDLATGAGQSDVLSDLMDRLERRLDE